MVKSDKINGKNKREKFEMMGEKKMNELHTEKGRCSRQRKIQSEFLCVCLSLSLSVCLPISLTLRRVADIDFLQVGF